MPSLTGHAASRRPGAVHRTEACPECRGNAWRLVDVMSESRWLCVECGHMADHAMARSANRSPES